MNHAVFHKFAVSGLVLAACAIGCKPAGEARPMAASTALPKAEKGAAKAAARAQAALAKHKPAIEDAEAAVALAPQDVRYRQLLGQAYLAAGRFASAQASFADAVALDPANGRARLSLALAQVANGRQADARETLGAVPGAIADTDRGLALALAGAVSDGVTVLERAARAPGADAKTRQNLALAYALAGEWAKAQATAAQDLAPTEVDARIQQWAAFARSDAGPARVASLLKVTPAEDPGLPTRLALAPSAPVQSAAAAPAPLQVAAAEPVAPAPVEVAAAAPVEAPFAPVEAPPLIRAPEGLIRVAYTPPAKVAPLVAAPVRRASLLAARKPAWVRQGEGGWVVQLGAFSRATPIDAAWSKVSAKVKLLGTYTPSTARFTLASATLTRLTLNGFATRDAAVRVCERIRAAGGPCFVRAQAGEAPVQMAARKKPEQFASR